MQTTESLSRAVVDHVPGQVGVWAMGSAGQSILTTVLSGLIVALVTQLVRQLSVAYQIADLRSELQRQRCPHLTEDGRALCKPDETPPVHQE